MGHGAQTTGRHGGLPRWTEDEARSALTELAQSGQSMAEFARRRGFSTARIRYWKERLGVTAAIPGFVPVSLPMATGTRVGPTIEIVAAERARTAEAGEPPSKDVAPKGKKGKRRS